MSGGSNIYSCDGVAIIPSPQLCSAETGPVVVMATTCDRSDVDTELLAGNRLGLDIEIKTPSTADRLDVRPLWLDVFWLLRILVRPSWLDGVLTKLYFSETSLSGWRFGFFVFE